MGKNLVRTLNNRGITKIATDAIVERKSIPAFEMRSSTATQTAPRTKVGGKSRFVHHNEPVIDNPYSGVPKLGEYAPYQLADQYQVALECLAEMKESNIHGAVIEQPVGGPVLIFVDQMRFDMAKMAELIYLGEFFGMPTVPSDVLDLCLV